MCPPPNGPYLISGKISCNPKGVAMLGVKFHGWKLRMQGLLVQSDAHRMPVLQWAVVRIVLRPQL